MANGQVEEVIAFSDPRRLILLLEAIRAKPARPLVSMAIETVALPRWIAVSEDYLRLRAQQRDQRDRARRAKGGAR